MTSPTNSITVSPSYGQSNVIVRWQFTNATMARNPKVFVLRSLREGAEWDQRNEDPIEHEDFYYDKLEIPTEGRVLYRLAVFYDDGKRELTDVVGNYDTLNFREYGIVRQMLNDTVTIMNRFRSGIKVFVCKPRRGGVYDPQKTTEGIVGGYATPMLTFMQPVQTSPRQNQDRPGKTVRITQKQVIFPGFPDIYPGDMVVNPVTDERYLVDSAEASKFRGIVPHRFACTITLLQRSDKRYNLQIDNPVNHFEDVHC